MAVKILVRGIDRTDYLWYGGSGTFNVMRGSRGTCSIPFILPPSGGFAPQVGDDIEVFDPEDTRCWIGTAEDRSVKWIGDKGWRSITMGGVSIEALFDADAENKVRYAEMQAGAIFTALFTASGVTALTLGRVDDGPIVKSLEVSNYSQGFSQLATIAGYVWYVNPEDLTLNFHRPAAVDSGFLIESTDVLWETLDYKQSRGEYRTSQQNQLSGTATVPSTAVFEPQSPPVAETDYVLPVVPAYLTSVQVSTGLGASVVAWQPGSDTVTITPAPSALATVTIKYVDASAAVGPGDAMGIGERTLTYTRTRTFTAAGAEQEAEAIVARFSLLPATLMLSTDKPGARAGQTMTIDLAYPAEAGDLINGVWMVQEVNASIVPGLEQLDDPFGHFRYSLHLINSAASALLQGDGSTEDFTTPEMLGDVSDVLVWNGGDDPNNPLDPFDPDSPYEWTWDGDDGIHVEPPPPDWSTIDVVFDPASFESYEGDGVTDEYELPEIPDAVQSIKVYDTPPDPISGGGGVLDPTTRTTFWGGGQTFTVDPPPEVGKTTVIRFTSGRAPDAPSFVDTWDQLADKGAEDPPALGGVPEETTGGTGGPQLYLRTLLLRNLTVGDDVADQVPVYASGTSTRLQTVLRRELTADLEIRLNKGGAEMITFTIPMSQGVGATVDIPLVSGSPPAAIDFNDGDVLSADILSSDGQKDKNGVASVTVEWTGSE